MLESKLYYLAQVAVLNCGTMPTDTKIEILRKLINQEDLALFVEKQKEKEKENADL